MTLPWAGSAALLRLIPGLVLVVVTIVGGVPVPFVDVVDMIAMGDCLVPAAGAMSVGVALVGQVRRQGVLVIVAIVVGVGVPVVDVVGVALTLHAGVPTLRAVLVRVRGMDLVLGGGHCSSLLCWTASATMWPTCWSAREYTASRPRRSTPTSLAPRSTRRCWETRGWLISSSSTSS